MEEFPTFLSIAMTAIYISGSNRISVVPKKDPAESKKDGK